jgi:hypothetical protein
MNEGQANAASARNTGTSRELRLPLDQIASYVGSDDVVIMCGLPLTGKSTVAKLISVSLRIPVVSTDLVRRELPGSEDIFDEQVASDMNKRVAVYHEALRRADGALRAGGGVVIDATFVTQSLRREAAKLAADHRRRLAIVETRCERSVSLARLQRRSREQYESNAMTEQAYYNNEMLFEKVDLDDLKRFSPNLDMVHLMIDTQNDSSQEWHIGLVEKA